MKLDEAIDKYVKDGDYLASNRFWFYKNPSGCINGDCKTRQKNLGFSVHMSSLDGSILTMGECFNRCDVSYGLAFEAMGVSKAMRRYFEAGKVKYTDWSNGVISWRLKAASMGIPFIPVRSMLGTDTEKYSAGVEIECPLQRRNF